MKESILDFSERILSDFYSFTFIFLKLTFNLFDFYKLSVCKIGGLELLEFILLKLYSNSYDGMFSLYNLKLFLKWLIFIIF